MEVLILAEAPRMLPIVFPIALGTFVAMVVVYGLGRIAIECVFGVSGSIARSRPSRRRRRRW